MQTSRFQLGLIATLAVGLGYSLSSSEAVGYPAGAAVSTGSNPVFSVGGHLSGTEVIALPIGSEGHAAVITDVILTGTDGSSSCRGSSRVAIQVPGSTLASFGIGVSYDSRSYANWEPQLVSSLQSGLRIDPGVTATIEALEQYEGGCTAGSFDVEYTLSGYYAQP